MDVVAALKIFVKKVPGRIPVGYWEQNGQVIFNTKPTPATANLAAPAQYVVTKNGEVYGTNPLQSDLDATKMKKLPTFGKKF